MFEMFKIEHFSKQKGVGHMALNARQIDMAAYLKQNRCATVKKLASHFYVSEMTVRRDLKELELRGYLKRYHGGAVYGEDYNKLPIETRKLLHADEKNRLSAAARRYIHDAMTVFMDSSSTCLYILPILAEYKDIKIITNSVSCLLDAAKYHIPCMMAGGEYFEHDMCTVGSETERFLQNYHIDVGFYSAAGISDDGVISDSDADQTAVRKAVMQHCSKNVFFFDSEKQNKKFFYILCRSDAVDEAVIL